MDICSANHEFKITCEKCNSSREKKNENQTSKEIILQIIIIKFLSFDN